MKGFPRNLNQFQICIIICKVFGFIPLLKPSSIRNRLLNKFYYYIFFAISVYLTIVGSTANFTFPKLQSSNISYMASTYCLVLTSVSYTLTLIHYHRKSSTLIKILTDINRLNNQLKINTSEKWIKIWLIIYFIEFLFYSIPFSCLTNAFYFFGYSAAIWFCQMCMILILRSILNPVKSMLEVVNKNQLFANRAGVTQILDDIQSCFSFFFAGFILFLILKCAISTTFFTIGDYRYESIWKINGTELDISVGIYKNGFELDLSFVAQIVYCVSYPVCHSATLFVLIKNCVDICCEVSLS